MKTTREQCARQCLRMSMSMSCLLLRHVTTVCGLENYFQKMHFGRERKAFQPPLLKSIFIIFVSAANQPEYEWISAATKFLLNPLRPRCILRKLISAAKFFSFQAPIIAFPANLHVVQWSGPRTHLGSGPTLNALLFVATSNCSCDCLD